MLNINIEHVAVEHLDNEYVNVTGKLHIKNYKYEK
jgi:hypothetical protein